MKDEDKSKAQLITELQMLREQLNRSSADYAVSQIDSTQFPTIHFDEEVFRSLIDSMPQSVFSKNLEGRFTFANQSYCTTEGKVLEEILGKTDFDLHPFKLAKKYQKDDQDVMRSGKTVQFVELHQPLGQSNFFVQVIKTPVYDSQGNVTGMLGIFWDVSDIKKAEEERLQLEKLDSLGILAGGIAHDFNNWLTGLFGNLELAKLYLAPDHKAYHFLDSADRSLEHLIKLTKQLLTFAKGGEPIKETVSIDELIVETTTFSIHGSNAKAIFDFPDTLWPVSVDKGQISQVISNLVINAQQAMPTGGTITIQSSNMQEKDGRYVVITVQDQGVGITQEHLDKIFDPYFTTKQKGSGLGLATSHSIINKHKGSISVSSRVNEGTCFTICLPAAETEEALADADTEQEAPGSVSGQSARILVMDDETELRMLLETILVEMGHRVTLAVNAEEAVEHYRCSLQNKDPFDLVILDLTIPGGRGGKAVAHEILNMDADAKLMVSSGYATDDVMAHYQKYGFKARVVKPYRLVELKSAVKQLLHQNGG